MAGRQQYETPEDRKKAWSRACNVARAYGYGAHENPAQYRIDFLLVSQSKRPPGNVIFLEVKCRNNASDKYPTFIISAAKWKEGVELAKNSMNAFCILASFTDGDYAYVYDPAHVALGHVYVDHGGRTAQTRDDGDIEPVMHIPLSLFEKVPQVP